MYSMYPSIKVKMFASMSYLRAPMFKIRGLFTYEFFSVKLWLLYSIFWSIPTRTVNDNTNKYALWEKIGAEVLNQSSSNDYLNYSWVAHLLILMMCFILQAIFLIT